MSRNSTNHARLNVEELETRQLLSAQITSALPAPVPAAPAAQPRPAGSKMPVVYGSALTAAPQPMIWTYTVVSLRNTTNQALRVQFRWSHTAAWASYTIPAHGYYYFYLTSYEPAAPQVRFNPSIGSQSVVDSLRYNTVRTSGTPTYADAYHYAFALQGHTLTLHPSST
jgi:hypothetical protein